MCFVCALVQRMTSLALSVPFAWQSASHLSPTCLTSLTGVQEKYEKDDEVDASASLTKDVASLWGWTEPAFRSWAPTAFLILEIWTCKDKARVRKDGEEGRSIKNMHLDGLLGVFDPSVLPLARQAELLAGGDVVLARRAVRRLLLLVLVNCGEGMRGVSYVSVFEEQGRGTHPRRVLQ